MKLISRGDNRWETEDGRAYIERDDTFETECDVDRPHPMRVVAADWRAGFLREDAEKRELLRLGAKEKGKYLTWQCYGGEVHYYSMWTVNVDGDWTDDVHDTFSQARDALEAIVGPLPLSRPRKPKVEPETVEINGRRLWEACYHRAEMDANENCYTCHGKLVY